MTVRDRVLVSFCGEMMVVPRWRSLNDPVRLAGDRTPLVRPRIGETGSVQVEPYPAPEVGARLAVDGKVPRGALSVRRTAQRAGWVVVCTYARGWLPHGRSGAPLRVVDNLALRMTHPDGRRAVAVWLDSRFDVAYRILPGLGKLDGVKGLTAFLVSTG